MNSLQQFILIAVATFASEDLTTIHTGVLVRQGHLGFVTGTLACFAGIFVGDMLLYLAGRLAGRAALHRVPLRWFLTESTVERSSQWLKQNGAKVILTSRFLPGTRLPTYFAAGLLRTSFRQFAGYFLLASALWTPMLVALSAWLGGSVIKSSLTSPSGWISLAFFAVSLWWLLRTALRLVTRRGRRLCTGQWRRIVHWEFWPPLVFYPPVIIYLLWLALKHRSLTLFTAANPAMPASGFVGESKSEILTGLGNAREFIARFALIRVSMTHEERRVCAEKFMADHQLKFPVILKPDAGQRGAGVQIIRSATALAAALAALTSDHILQEYIAGVEFGVFYFRYPGASRGRIFSITEKRFPVVTGDGMNTLEALVHNDERAVCLADTYGERHQARWQEVIPRGECITLAELGSHCRGAIFLDGSDHLTSSLSENIEHISQSYEGFYFGRYDIRAASIEAFQAGAFKVIELNGVTAEATHIYDRRYRVWQAYQILFAQWRTAFAIGAANRQRGARVYGWRELMQMTTQFYGKAERKA